MGKLKGAMLITPKEIQLITGKGYGACHREHQAIRDSLGIKNNRLTVKEYCDYNQFDYEEVVNHLNQNR